MVGGVDVQRVQIPERPVQFHKSHPREAGRTRLGRRRRRAVFQRPEASLPWHDRLFGHQPVCRTQALGGTLQQCDQYTGASTGPRATRSSNKRQLTALHRQRSDRPRTDSAAECPKCASQPADETRTSCERIAHHHPMVSQRQSAGNDQAQGPWRASPWPQRRGVICHCCNHHARTAGPVSVDSSIFGALRAWNASCINKSRYESAFTASLKHLVRGHIATHPTHGSKS